MNKYHAFYSTAIIATLCLVTLIASIAPRALSFAPALIGFLGLIAYKPIRGTWPRLTKRAFVWSIAICSLACISSLWAIDPDLVLQRSTKMALILIPGAALFTLIRALPTIDTQHLSLIFTITTLTLGLIISTDLYMDGTLHKYLHNVAQDTEFNFSNLNRSVVVYTTFLFITVPTIIFAQHSRYRKGLWLSLVAIVSVLIFAKTESQSSQLALLIGGILFIAFPYKRKTAWYVLALTLFTTIVMAPFAAQFLFQNATTYLMEHNWFQNGFAGNRLEIWDFISRYALQNPIYGFGIEATRAVEAFDTQMLYHPTQTILHPHNFALQLWIEFGIVGVIFSILFFGYLLAQIQKTIGPKHYTVSAKLAIPLLFAVIAVSSTGYGLWQSWWLGYFTLLIALSTFSARCLYSDTQKL